MVYQAMVYLTSEHLFYIIKSACGVSLARIPQPGVSPVQPQRRIKPHLKPLGRESSLSPPESSRGLLTTLRRLFARAHAQPHPSIEVEPDLFARLRRAARARYSSPQALARDLLARGLEQEALKAHAEAVLGSLTPREAEVLWRAAYGHTNRKIADALVISPETVKTHVRNILLKLGLRSKADLRLLMLDLGLRWWQDE
jgi:DNA-binding CsgD family transcriptional regulator